MAAMVTLQSGASFAKQFFSVVGIGGAISLRISLAALVLLLVFRPWRLRLTAAQWRAMSIYGLSLGGMQFLFYFALARIPLGVGVALEFTGPLLLALLGSRRKTDLLWVVFAVVGLLLLIPKNTDASALDPIGVLLALGAGGCWAGYIWFGQRAGSLGSGGATVAIGLSVAALFYVPLGLTMTDLSLLSWSVLPMGLFIAVLSSALPYSLEMIALSRLSTQHFSIMMSLEPAVAALAGLMILGEQLSLIQWLAISLIIVASMGSTASAAQKPKVTTE